MTGWAHAVHILLSITTLGLWFLFVYAPLMTKRTNQRWQCASCGGYALFPSKPI